jgi:hypothetical protein
MSGWALAPGPEMRGDLYRDEGRQVPGRVPGDEGPTAVQMRALIIPVMLLAWLAALVLLWW